MYLKVSMGAPMLLGDLDLRKSLSWAGCTNTAAYYEQLVVANPFSHVFVFPPKVPSTEPGTQELSQQCYLEWQRLPQSTAICLDRVSASHFRGTL